MGVSVFTGKTNRERGAEQRKQRMTSKEERRKISMGGTKGGQVC